MAPVSKSPLDCARGRGKRRNTRTRQYKSRCEASNANIDDAFPCTVVLKIENSNTKTQVNIGVNAK